MDVAVPNKHEVLILLYHADTQLAKNCYKNIQKDIIVAVCAGLNQRQMLIWESGECHSAAS